MCQVIDDDTRWRNRFIFEVMCVADATEAVNYIKVQNSNYGRLTAVAMSRGSHEVVRTHIAN